VKSLNLLNGSILSAITMLSLAGCNRGAQDVPMVEAQYILISELDGKTAVVPAGELIHSRTGAPMADKVLAFNRQTGRSEWVAVETLYNSPPSQAIHHPYTQTDPDAFSEAPPP
jgi:hypothetical protein